MQLGKFVQDQFSIDNPETGALVPFQFRKVQQMYYEQLCLDYSEKNNFSGLREVILKARKEGFTSFVLGLFGAMLVLSSDPVRYLEISYKDDATKQHFKRIKTYILSYFMKRTGIKDIRKLERIVFSSISENEEFTLAHNGASFYVGTASARTAERGGTVQGILFSEAAHFPDTGIISAKEIIEGTRNMVAVGTGMIFIETTANGMNHFYKLWKQAERGEVDYKPRFFGWRDMYTPEQFELIRMGFSDKSLIPQEYPENPMEAFIASGDKFFETAALQKYLEGVQKPIRSGLVYV